MTFLKLLKNLFKRNLSIKPILDSYSQDHGRSWKSGIQRPLAFKSLSKLFSLCQLFLFSLCILACDASPKEAAQEDSQETLDALASSDAFDKKALVFDVPILATEGVSKEKMQHAIHVMAKYLDPDEDGSANNPLVVDAMVKSQATLYMVLSESEIESIDNAEELFLHDFAQDLRANEVHPQGRPHTASGPFDATLEEVLHIITHAGYAQAYPDVFGEKEGSEIANAMDKARGGKFTTVPSNYPSSAWFTYNDSTCDYACQVAEYTYWAITSFLGVQGYSERLQEIQNEWQPHTKNLLKKTDRDVYSIIKRSKYEFPQQFPDGSYNGPAIEIEEK